MKIVGQSFIDPSERFFHGMYLSAAGNPFYGSPVDGAIPISAGIYIMPLLLAIIIAAALISSYVYMSKRTKPIVTPSPIN